ncbi:MAG: M1 family metallopeptidase [Candidatus Aenigmarchaeota archaeon]|nr:M1 family metallopeptidase [Candidatus Aenigmarchaeota archaeon]
MLTTNDYRLPGNVIPVRYDIKLEPDIEKSVFLGEETVEIEVKKQTKTVSLNSEDLKIVSAELVAANGKSVLSEKITEDRSRQALSIHFRNNLSPGKAKLLIKFSGNLNDQLRGFYRSKYTNPEGGVNYIATTQFEATDARRAFPCWDDPATKAIFKVTLVIPENLTAISNTLVERENKISGRKKELIFKETPKMSTYLLAFIVGDFKCVERKSGNGTLLRVWATRGNEEKGRFALDTTSRLLEYFNDYFGIPYPLEKLDQIAIPDFAAGAMENWGAITYRETVLLFDPKHSSANTKQRIAEVVAHEMAHQWFGDLVTMEWWDDLWLNESFASWMGNKSTDKIFPEWKMWTQFILNDTSSGMSLDGLRNSHPIEAHVKNPAEIRELFDAISYSKGAATIRMLENFLGEEIFRKGLSKYLSEHAYSNARTEDLWDALDEVSGKPVTGIMDTWVKQTGFPFVDVKSYRSGKGIRIKLSQKRFLYNNLIDDKEDPTLWKIPVNAEVNGEKISFVMDKRNTDTLVKQKNSKSEWIKLNSGQGGFYRVKYQDDGWNGLIRAVSSMKLSSNDRLGLHNDSYALMKAGYISPDVFLSLIEAYKDEMDAIVLEDVSSSLRSMKTLLSDESSFQAFREFSRNFFAPIAKKVGWDPRPGEGHLDSLRRSIVLSQAGHYGDRETIKKARVKFKGYLEDPLSLHPDLRGVVFGLVAHGGDRADYDKLWEMEGKAVLHEEKLRLLGALGHFRQVEFLEETLKNSLDVDKVRSQDTVFLIGQVFSSKQGRDLCWNFIKSNWPELYRRYGDGGFAITRLVALTGSFTRKEMADDVEKFFKTHPAPSATRTVQQSLERIKLNEKWLEKNRSSVAGWLASRGHVTAQKP